MRIQNVVQLGKVRDLIGEWDRVRDRVVTGAVDSFYLVVRNDDGRETVYLGGVYKDQPNEAVRAILKMSAARMLAEDEPLRLKAV